MAEALEVELALGVDVPVCVGVGLGVPVVVQAAPCRLAKRIHSYFRIDMSLKHLDTRDVIEINTQLFICICFALTMIFVLLPYADSAAGRMVNK